MAPCGRPPAGGVTDGGKSFRSYGGLRARQRLLNEARRIERRDDASPVVASTQDAVSEHTEVDESGRAWRVQIFESAIARERAEPSGGDRLPRRSLDENDSDSDSDSWHPVGVDDLAGSITLRDHLIRLDKKKSAALLLSLAGYTDAEAGAIAGASTEGMRKRRTRAVNELEAALGEW